MVKEKLADLSRALKELQVVGKNSHQWEEMSSRPRRSSFSDLARQVRIQKTGASVLASSHPNRKKKTNKNPTVRLKPILAKLPCLCSKSHDPPRRKRTREVECRQDSQSWKVRKAAEVAADNAKKRKKIFSAE